MADGQGKNDGVRQPSEPTARNRDEKEGCEKRGDAKPSPDGYTHHEATRYRSLGIVDHEVCADDATENADAAANDSGIK